MLEIRNLTKIYQSKTGESVKALDDVSISFPESGMVFILGKSGSGKSTLLNIMGGLDSYDSGEFIIKGKSSKDFAGSDFDAYRNTFIGFIFQEYNVLDDFTVGANIALALELQGKKALPEKINDILSQVDLLNYAKRKPNELSGGQKQRVAIARALVKEPQIIMADEPTGALDSNTGKQIFDSLKKLSRDKLVLVVSHDRDFAERYADRIVELSDGKIISDVTKHERESVRLSEGIERFSSQILRIKRGYRLTEKDLQMINEYLSGNNADVLLSGDGRVNDELRSVAGISDTGTISMFEGTDAEKDVRLKTYEKKDSSFIRSKLPAKNALRMGASGLKHKKFRLTMTVLLSMISFALFGFADSMAAYNKITSATDSLVDSNVKNASVSLGVRRTITTSDGEVEVFFNNAPLNDEDLAYLRQTTGLNFVPVFTGSITSGGYNSGWSVASMMKSFSDTEVYTGKLHGMVALGEDQIAATGYRLTGRMPQKQGEIVITELLYRQLNQFGFVNSEHKESVPAGSLTMETGSSNSIIGKHLTLPVGMMGLPGKGYSFEIVGVLDTGFDYTRYEQFLPQDENDVLVQEEGNMLVDSVLRMEIESELNYGFHGLGYTTSEDIEEIAKLSAANMNQQLGTRFDGWESSYYISVTDPSVESEGDRGDIGFHYNNRISEGAPSSVLPKLDIKWLDGVARDALAANEVVLPSSLVESLYPQRITATLDVDGLKNRAIELDLFEQSHWEETEAESLVYQRIRQATLLGYIDQILEDPDALNQVILHAQTNGYSDVTDVIGARQYWLNSWLNGWDSAPPMSDPTGVLTYDEVVEDMNETLTPAILTLSGLHASLAESQNVLEKIFERFNNITVSEPEFTLEQWDIRDALFEDAIEQDIVKGKLWQNSEFVAMMLASSYEFPHGFDWNTARDAEKEFQAGNFYRWYLMEQTYGYNHNPYGSVSGSDLESESKAMLLQANGMTEEQFLSSLVIERFEENHELQHSTSLGVYSFKIVGLYDSAKYLQGDMIISDVALADYKTWASQHMGGFHYTEEIAPHDDGIWAYVLAPMGNDVSVIRQLVEMTYDESGNLKFMLQNPIMDTLDSFNSFIETGSKIFLYVGIGFAVFSALLLMNFIATSISYKKREIGVLRAVGARSSDVFKIFFGEALMIAVINFLLSTAAVVAAIIVTNGLMRKNGINITLLHYGVRQFILMLVISVAVALLASFLPVNGIAKKKPVDAIKDR